MKRFLKRLNPLALDLAKCNRARASVCRMIRRTLREADEMEAEMPAYSRQLRSLAAWHSAQLKMNLML